ncbi:MAG TPA: hypothetical protein VM013_03695 [Dehalococcoidia bacterium]|nr:hypothetical protein [Dehalococcoidia bacterium]
MTDDDTIAKLPEIVAALPGPDRAVFRRIFRVDAVEGQIVPPDSMRPWIERHFGAVEPTLSQRIVRVTNLVTCRGALFNPLRSRRPHSHIDETVLDAEMAADSDDPLEQPLAETPADVFGRIEGKHCITGANVAKFDGFHSLVIFKEHNPLRLDQEMLRDYFDTGLRWAEAAHAVDPAAKYFLFMWNCLWRAGASLVHGHAQVLLGRDAHYPAVEGLRRAARDYRARHNADYFDDLFRAHAAAGCAFEREGVRILANLAPVKENEVLLIAPQLTDSLKDRTYEALACLRDRLGVASFNLALYLPPIAPVEEDWGGFPAIVHVVDRGDLAGRTSDIGAMELYAASVIAGDPLRLARLLKDTLGA